MSTKTIAILIAISLCILLFVGIVKWDQKNLYTDYDALEDRYGKLELYTPQQCFVHFRTEDNHEVFCLKNDDGKYTFLGKWKLKE